MGDGKKYIIDQIVRYCQKLDCKGFGANHDGNISAKYEETLLATPTAMSKGDITSELIITLGMDGNKISGIGKPFSEIKLHLAVYNEREDVRAVIHAHPPFATARGLTGLDLKISIPEAIVSIGDLITVLPYAMPGSEENNDMVRNAVHDTNVFILQGNGVIAVGADLEQAYLRLELVEHLSKIEFYATQMGASFSLPDKDVAVLLEKRATAGLDPKGSGKTSKISTNDTLEKLIAEEIRNVLGGN